MNKIFLIIKTITIIAFGVFGGYLLYYFVLMDIADVYLDSTSNSYFFSSVLLLILSISSVVFILFMVTGYHVNKKVFYVVLCAYFIVLFFILFGRPILVRKFNFNLIASLQELTTDSESLLQFILNIIVLMPIAYFFKNKGVIFTELIFLAISFGIEIMQYITARGFFDIIDILCYMIGMNLAYLFFKLTKVDIVKRK